MLGGVEVIFYIKTYLLPLSRVCRGPREVTSTLTDSGSGSDQLSNRDGVSASLR